MRVIAPFLVGTVGVFFLLTGIPIINDNRLLGYIIVSSGGILFLFGMIMAFYGLLRRDNPKNRGC